MTVTSGPYTNCSVTEINSADKPVNTSYVPTNSSVEFGPYLVDKTFKVEDSLSDTTVVISFDGIGSVGGSADEVTYSNVTSGLAATNVQDAIDEIEAELSSLSTPDAEEVFYSNLDSELTADNVQDAIDEIVALIDLINGFSGDYNDLTNKPTLGTASALDSIDEDDMVSNSNTKLPTQQSVKAYVDAASFSGDAADVTYDNASSGLTAVTVQAAIDELDTTLDGLSAPDLFKTIAVAGQSDIVADSSADTLTVVGTNLTITTNAATDTLTIAAGTMAAETAANYTKTSGLATVATTGAYSDLSGTPTIPSAIFKTLAVSGQSDIVADSSTDTLTVVGTNLTITTDAGTDTLTIAAGTMAKETAADYTKTSGLATVATTGAYSDLSGTPTIPSAIFKTISVSGQSDVVADSSTDTLTLVSGSGIAITTNATTDTITVTSTITQYTDELAQDAVGGMAANGTFVSLTYNDSTPSLKAELSATGTPSGTTFLRGDNTWATPSGGSGIDNVVEDTSPQLGGDLDVNGFSFIGSNGTLLVFSDTASAVNYVQVTNNSTNFGPDISAQGSDSNIDLSLSPKGTGKVVTFSPLQVYNDINTTGLVNGRDIAADGAVLDSLSGGGNPLSPLSLMMMTILK